MASIGTRRRLAHWTGLLLIGVVTAACSSKPAPASSSASPAASTAPPRTELWGELKPVVSVKELMRDMLDPAADNIFDAVKSVSTKDGTVDRLPKTDEDWEK